MAAKTAKKPAKAKTKAKAAAKPKVVAKAAAPKVKAAAKPKTVAKAAAKPNAAAKAKAPAKAPAKAKATSNGAKTFAAPKFQEFTIRDNAGVVGHVRVKPNAVAWKAKSSKAYQQISIDQLAAYAAEHGRQVKAEA